MKNLIPEGFELNNLQRRYLGLDEVMPHWDRVTFGKRMVLYFDGDVVRKQVEYTPLNGYQETDHHEMTAENRTILLPKTKRGKPKKLNYSASNSFSYNGVYFYFSERFIVIGNYTTQTSFYEEDNDDKLAIGEWLDKWVDETTEQNLAELRRFKESKRQHQKYAEGDFFTFKVGRNKWGFGRIVLNITERLKSPSFREANPGFCNLMGKALYIAVYRKLSDTPDADIDQLRHCEMLPTQAIMDNRFYYGSYRIIGNRVMEPDEWEPIISYSEKFSRGDKFDFTYLQYGLICKKEDTRIDERYIKDDRDRNSIYQNQCTGFGIIHYSKLEKIVNEGIDNDSLLRDNDLRKKSNRGVKQEIFSSLGLDANKSYAENLRIVEESSRSTNTPSNQTQGFLARFRNKFGK